ncbi:branched-subunit amino acid transport protein [Actimicrobium sp. GrIS 1.19]|uniref:AzlD domain-containing protein n=1 Tax=Actimicrobium sp. GrIS 1.19 TaxID=3071708 RepID=UPI002E0B128E|nr:branched-subunit amino acid transport protein [Actimicrobium sp. GrIS 1.19]
MSTIEIWITIALLTLATLISRSTFFVLGHAVKLPERVQHALRYAPAAAMAAIIAPDLMLAGGTLNLSPANPRLLAAVVATVFFIGTKHLLGTIIVGMAAYTLLRLYL